MNVPFLRNATVVVVVALTLAACGNPLATASVNAPAVAAPADDLATATAAPIPTATATVRVTPAPTAVPKHARHIASNIQIAGVDVSGLTAQAAQQKLVSALAPLFEPLLLQADTITATLNPADVGLKLAYDEMVAEALAANDGARVPLRASYDEVSVRATLQQLAGRVAHTPTFAVITSTASLSTSFTLVPGTRLDQQTAAQLIGTRLRTLSNIHSLSLTLVADVGTGHPSPEALQQQIERIAGNWRGVVGVHVYDLDHDTDVAQSNANTVFSGASVMKAAIMLQVYVQLPSFSDQQQLWLQQMIIDSDNSAANHLLAASVGGSGAAGTVAGAEQMTAMLRGFGIEHTYQYAPYLAPDLVLRRNIRIRIGPVQEGSAPFTRADRYLRATPAEMSQVFRLIYQCSQGRGDLLAQYAQQLSAARCQEMIDRLHDNADDSRLVAGLPPDTYVAHKSGWIDDMQADVGIIHTPGGTFLIAVYVYQSQGFKTASATSVIPILARLAYSYYNPILINDER